MHIMLPPTLQQAITPSIFFWGRVPTSPVDHLLGKYKQNPFVDDHHTSPMEAFKTAADRTEEEVLHRKLDRKAEETDLAVGTRFFSEIGHTKEVKLKTIGTIGYSELLRDHIQMDMCM